MGMAVQKGILNKGYTIEEQGLLQGGAFAPPRSWFAPPRNVVCPHRYYYVVGNFVILAVIMDLGETAKFRPTK